MPRQRLPLPAPSFRIRRLILRSFAKLNLYLKVLKKRRDNYHDIETIFERIDLSDEIILTSRRDEQIKITCNTPQVPRDNSNLCYKSAKLIQEKFNINEGLDIKIIKRIPVAAGLAGGSSNAAAVLMGLNEFWRLGLSKKRLVDLSKAIGCDVPFFIHNCPFAEGKNCGERVRPLSMLNSMQLWHIVVVPKIKVSTPLIYERWDQALQAEKKPQGTLTKAEDDVKILTLALKKNKLSLVARMLFNDLERITSRLYPEVSYVREKLVKLGLKSILMSGSGPAVFGICSSRKEAVFLSGKLKKLDSSWRVFVVATR